MWLLLSVTLIVGATAEVLDGLVNIDDEFEPLVAFACGRPSMYATTQGWKMDRTQGCLSNTEEILAYCALKYPGMEITNIIPAASEVSIGNWGAFMNSSETQTLSVRPYRCIIGPFESDALLVPDQCQFAHYESGADEVVATVCVSYEEWNATVRQRCVAENTTFYSFSVILPCAAGVFAGAEYVCCPSTTVSISNEVDTLLNNLPKPTIVVDEPNETQDLVDYVDEDPGLYVYDDPAFDDDDDDDVYVFDSVDENDSQDGDAVADYQYDDDDYDPKKNYYEIYMNTPEQLATNEHDAYNKAVRYVNFYYIGQKEQLMEELAELQPRIDELSTKNVSGAQSMLQQGIQTIRQLYDKTVVTHTNVRRAMYTEHMQRVEMRLEDNRLDRGEAWKNALDDASEYDDLESLKPLMQALKQYLRSEEKERIHWINRYEHLLDVDPEEAEHIKSNVQLMLRQIQQRINAVEMSLKRVPRIQGAVLSMLKEFLESFDDVDQEVRLLFPDMDLSAQVRQMLPDEPQIDTNDLQDPLEPQSDAQSAADWMQTLVPPKRRTLLLVVSVASGVTMFLFCLLLACCCARKLRKSEPSHRSRVTKSTTIFVVPTHEKHSPLHSVMSRIVRSPTHKVRNQELENSYERGARLALEDDEDASLITRDVLDQQNVA